MRQSDLELVHATPYEIIRNAIFLKHKNIQWLETAFCRSSIIIHYCPLLIIIDHTLVGGWALPLWKMMEWKSVGMMIIPNIYIEIWKKTCSKPPTSTSPIMKTHNQKNNMVDRCLDVSEVFLPGLCGKKLHTSWPIRVWHLTITKRPNSICFMALVLPPPNLLQPLHTSSQRTTIHYPYYFYTYYNHITLYVHRS